MNSDLKIESGDRVYRMVYVGSRNQFDEYDVQPLTVIRVNRVTVTVETDEGSRFRMDPDAIRGRYEFDADDEVGS